MLRRVRAVAIALAVPALLAQVAFAQTRGNAARPAARPAGARPPAVQKKPPADGGPSATGTTSAAPASFGASPAPASADAGVVETKGGDGGTHVFRFSELDIEGRLKSPQLVYFLRRVRAEFAAGDLGHRSFMREMSETRKERTF